MVDKEMLRERLLKYINNEGVNQKFIANQTKISETSLSRFKNRKAELYLVDCDSLDEYLSSKGY